MGQSIRRKVPRKKLTLLASAAAASNAAASVLVTLMPHNNNNNSDNNMGQSIRRKVPRKKLLASAAAASDAAASDAAASVLVTPKPRGRGRPPERRTQRKQNQQDRDDRREALLESATIADSPPPGSPLGPSILALLSPASLASVSSSLRSSTHNGKRKVGDTDNNNSNSNSNNNTPSKLLCMAGYELKNDLATILDVRAENLVETQTFLLNKLNDTGVAMDESLTDSCIRY
jgi:hypothetical protein